LSETKTDRQMFIIATMAIIGIIILGAGSWFFILLQQTQVGEYKNVIAVSGEGTLLAKPDQAQVSLGVLTQAQTADVAQQLNAEKMNKVIKAILDQGIAENKIKTRGYSLYPIFEYPTDGKAPIIVGYNCRNTVTITLSDINIVGKIIDVSVAAGSNEVESVYFEFSEEKANELRNEALQKAVENADAKAKTLAKSLGVQIVGPTQVSISSMEVPRAYVSKGPAGEMTPIPPGELKFTISVQVTYAFK